MSSIFTSSSSSDDNRTKKNYPIVIGVLNLANSQMDEQNDDYRFGKRLENIKGVLEDHFETIDVLCLSEIRVCKDANGDKELSPVQITTDIAEAADFAIAALNPVNLTRLSFWRAALHHKETVIPIKTICINPFPVEHDRIMISFHKFKHTNLGDIFWVIHNHMPMKIEEKMKTIRWLNDNALKICWNENEDGDSSFAPVMFYGGDQNTFFDVADDGDRMMAEFKKGGWMDLTSGIKQTFQAFPHNPTQITSKLDHWFVYETKTPSKINIVRAQTVHMYPDSDHDLILIEFEFKSAEEHLRNVLDHIKTQGGALKAMGLIE